ncbi:MAG: dihydrodipicolinate synthase family protein [Geminicoccaceae bacterium]
MGKLDGGANGVFIISATPFAENDALDWASTDKLIDFYLEKGVSGITILGIMGEAPKLTFEEAKAFARHVLKRVEGRVPVIVGVSSPGFATMSELAACVMDDGAAGVMVAPPATLKGDDAVYTYFSQTVRHLGDDTPWVLQDYPLASGVVMSPKLIRRIADDMPTCVMLKHEDWPGLDKITALRRMEAEGARRLSILVGNGGLFLPLELERGVDGAMTGFAYPEMLVAVVERHGEGRPDVMMDLFDIYLPLLRYEQQPQVGLAARKYILKKRGVLASDTLRAPAPRLTPESRAEIDRLIQRLERAVM